MSSRVLFLLLFLSTTVFAQQKKDQLPAKDSIVDYQRLNSDRNNFGDYNPAFHLVDRVNEGLPPKPARISLATPQSTMEHFIRSAREGDYHAAAHALNFNLLPANLQQDQAAILAEKLHYILRQRIAIKWDQLPDRPDGQTNRNVTMDAIEGAPRRAIQFGQISLDGREIPLNLQRLRADDAPPVWMISSSTVENIEALYAQYGPSWINRATPEWAENRVLGVKLWKLLGILLAALICYFIAWGIYKVVVKIVTQSDNPWISELGGKMATPISLAGGSLLFYIAMSSILKITGSFSPYLYSLLLAIVIISVTWLIMRAIDYAIKQITRLKVADVSDEENLESRRLLTYITVGRWVLTAIVVTIGISIILNQFPNLKNLGVSLLASAGIATVILGIAAQSTLGNIVAGLQIAITKPARIGDSIITHDGEYGTVEDIRFTYLVVKTWDARRLVIPLKYFIDNPFQNWSMNDPHLIKPIILYVNYGTNIDKIRKKFAQLCEQHELYDGERSPDVQVVGSDKEAVKVRCLSSAKDASAAWTLHVELREAMVNYLADLGNGAALARERVSILSQS